MCGSGVRRSVGHVCENVQHDMGSKKAGDA